jgi:hypothetical protein
MSSQLLELMPASDIGLAREQFERIGHVGLRDLYDPSLAEQAIHDTAVLSRKPQIRSGGEQASTLTSAPHELRHAKLYAVFQGIIEGAALLGRDLTASGRGEKTFMLVIEMQRGTQGPQHRDEVLSDVVAVTNLHGKSRLWYEDSEHEDGVEYELEPGCGVFHDFDRKLLHQGSTGPEDRRVGLVVGKIAARRFMRRAA